MPCQNLQGQVKVSSSEDHQTYIFSSMSPPIMHPYIHLSISPSPFPPSLPLPFPPFIFLPPYPSLTLDLLIPQFPLYPPIFSSIHFFIPPPFCSSLHPNLHSFTPSSSQSLTFSFLPLSHHSPISLCIHSSISISMLPSIFSFSIHFIHPLSFPTLYLFLHPSILSSSLLPSLHLSPPISPPLHPSLVNQSTLNLPPSIPLHFSFHPSISPSLYPLIESSQRTRHYQCVS